MKTALNHLSSKTKIDFNHFQCLVLCFRLHFTKDTIVVNTASATVRQLVNGVFERVIAEDSANASAEKEYDFYNIL